MTISSVTQNPTAKFTVQALETLDASDLVVLVQSLEVMYGVLLTYRFAAEFRGAPNEPVGIIARPYLQDSLVRLEQGWPDFLVSSASGLLVDPELIDREYRGQVIVNSEYHSEHLEQRQALLRSLYNGIYRAVPSATLKVHSIRIASPGPISFAGLGEPLREIREFIKDVWYRNRHESLLAEIEVEKARMQVEEMRLKLGYSVQPSHVTNGAILLANSSASLRQLGRQGKVSIDSLEVSEDQ